MENSLLLSSMNLKTQKVLSIIYTTGYFILLVVYLLLMPHLGIKLPSENASVVNILIGILTAEVPRVNAFWFGSSFGSKMKDAKGEK